VRGWSPPVAGGVGSLAVNMLADKGYEVITISGKADQTGFLE